MNLDPQLLKNLLRTEHQNFIHWLHDDLGQNLVAIKSFASAIQEEHGESSGDTAKLAEFIKRAADFCYRSTYDLMQELRAGEHAELPAEEALRLCIEEARLKLLGIECSLGVDIKPDLLDSFTLSIILRCVRGFINLAKRSSHSASLAIELYSLGNRSVELRLIYRGHFDINPEQSAELIALRKRIESIGGKMQFYRDESREYSVTLRLGRESCP